MRRLLLAALLAVATAGLAAVPSLGQTAPGAAFTLDGAAISGARLGFACLTEDELGRAVRGLAAAADAVRRSR